MSDSVINKQTEFRFPMVIAITALILSLTSGIVNYRQNNLSNLESSLRDTRDQLQLAKNDITDIRMKTVQQLVDAELAVKNQAHLKVENIQLTEKLRESGVRMGELEAQIRRMDHQLSQQKTALKRAGRKAKASENTGLKKVSLSVQSGVSPASANVDIYMKHVSAIVKQELVSAIQAKGFKPKFPKLLDSMNLSSQTTVYYYHRSYEAVAQDMVKLLAASSHDVVTLKRGASPYAKNKIIVHVIGR
ncbi:MAG: hypothetical protein Q9M16_05280 [Mariprofundus sp.]|nr:hypothetical protein [Mariprofundus sp.]